MYNLILPLRYNEDYFKKGLSLTNAEQQIAFSEYQELLGVKVPKVQTLTSLFSQLETKLMRELDPEKKIKRLKPISMSYTAKIFYERIKL